MELGEPKAHFSGMCGGPQWRTMLSINSCTKIERAPGQEPVELGMFLEKDHR